MSDSLTKSWLPKQEDELGPLLLRPAVPLEKHLP